MKQLTIQVPDGKYPFFLELVNSLGFVKQVKVDAAPSKAKVLEGVKDAVAEVKQIKSGKKKAVLLKDFLDEL